MNIEIRLMALPKRRLHKILHSHLPSQADSMSMLMATAITHSLQPTSSLEQTRQIMSHAFWTAAVLSPPPAVETDIVDVDACKAGHCFGCIAIGV